MAATHRGIRVLPSQISAVMVVDTDALVGGCTVDYPAGGELAASRMGKGERPEMIKPPEEARAVNVVGAVDRSDIRAELARRRKRLGGS